MFNIINEGDFRALVGKTAGRAFLFFGEEDYLKATTLRALRKSVSPDEAFAMFNDVTLDTPDFDAEKLLDAVSAPPMMSEERLVVVRGLDLAGLKATEREALDGVLAQLETYNYTTLVLYAPSGSIDEGALPKRPSAALKKWQSVLTPVWFAAPTEARLAKWTAQHFGHFGVRADPAFCALFVSYVGQSMYVLAGEIEKTAYFVLAAGRDAVTEADMRAAASPALACDAFALSNAILDGNHRAALSALAVLKFERVEPTVVLGEIARTLADMQSARYLLDAGRGKAEIAAALRIHEYRAGLLSRAAARTDAARLARAVRLCAEADLSLKRASADFSPIERLICSL